MIRCVKKEDQKFYRQKCGSCGCEFEYQKEDIDHGAFGCAYVVCPECSSKGNIEIEDDFELTAENVKFPQHFAQPGGVKIKEEEINEMIQRVLNGLKNRSEPFLYTARGNTMVLGCAMEDEYAIYVTDKYWETAIPR